MTDLLSPNDTGEIPRIVTNPNPRGVLHDFACTHNPCECTEVRIPGEETVRLVGEQRTQLDVGEATQNLAGWDADLPPVLRRPDATGEIPALTSAPYGLSHPRDLEGPQKPPPPLPPPPKDLAAAQPLWPLERVVGVEETAVQSILEALGATRDGELFMVPLPRPIPPTVPIPPQPQPQPKWRHAEPTLWQRVTHWPKHRKASPWWGWAQLAVLVVAAAAVGWWLA